MWYYVRMNMRFFRVAGAILIAIFFSIPQLWSWARVDSYQEPIRHYDGDTAHYLSILHTTVVEGTPRAQAYFWEEPDSPPQFWIFQTVASIFHPLRSISIVWFDLALTLLVGLAVFLLFDFVLCRAGVPVVVSAVVSLCFVLLYGPIAFRGYALGNWFLPVFLGGMAASLRFFEAKEIDLRALGWALCAVVLFAVHPVYFAMGGLSLGLLWIARLSHKQSKSSLKFFAVWGAFSISLFFYLFFAFLKGTPAGEDTLYRIVALDTRLPFHILLGARLGLLSVVAYSVGFLPIASFAGAAFVGLFSFVLTGQYIANDHYAIPEDFLAPALFLGLLFSGAVSSSLYKFKFLRVAFLGVALLSLFDVLQYLNFRPGYLGRFAPMLGGYLGIALILNVPHAQVVLKKLLNDRRVLVVFCLFSLIYGSVITYRDLRPVASAHREAQEYRMLIGSVRKLSNGVVLADPYIENLISLYTPHKVYWSHIAFSETVLNEELKARWLDTSLFFEGSRGLEPVFVTGTTDRCYEYERIKYLNFFESLGFSHPKKVLCGPVEEREALWPVLKQEAQEFASSTVVAKTWAPQYKLDYLIVDTKKNNPPTWLVEDYFVLSATVGERFRIYGRKN